MKKLLLTSVAAAGLAMAGAVQAASTFDAPLRAGEASTMTQGRPNLLTTNSPYPDGTVVLHARPVVVTSPVLPAWHPPVAIVNRIDADPWRADPTPTSNIPTWSGEASTMTHGQPNMVTNNWQSPRLNPMLALQQTPDYPYGFVWQR
jgi:hypothetical protein